MTEDQILKVMESAIADAENGLSKENPKFDFKSKWYDLKSESEIMEFIKDTAANANTVGLDGFILIGYNERERKFEEAKFSDSNLKDSHHLNGIIVKHVSPPFTLNSYDIVIRGNKCSVLHIPPSLDKPHCVKLFRKFDKDGSIKSEYKNATFVRRGTSCEIANRYELDLMYYDRKNIEPDYLFRIYLTGIEADFNQARSSFLYFTTTLLIENIGRRPLGIESLGFSIENPYDKEAEILLLSESNKEEKFNTLIDRNNLVINPKVLTKFPSITFKLFNPNSNVNPNDVCDEIIQKMRVLKSAKLLVSLVDNQRIVNTLVFKL